ncbi:MAG: glycosyltransferase [Proteobacteria bacterium]|nr:glycosyltransferase [Pseudomonadota bacterium]
MKGSGQPVPDLTIGLPVYNGERYLAGALDSILSQSYNDFLLVISDNASSDDTRDICEDYAARDERITYVRQEKNMGGAWNFNAVVEHASSPMFKWISHDDLTGEGFLELCMAELVDAPDDVILCYPRTILIDDEGEPIGDFDDDLDLRQESPCARLRGYLDNYKMSNPIFGVIRRNLLTRTSMLGSYASSDKVLMAEMAIVGKFWELPDRLFLRRYHEEMSRKANVTPDEVAAWFDPNHPHPVSMTRSKLYVEYMRSIASARLGLSPADRARCMKEMVASGGFHEIRVVGGEMKRETKIGLVRSKKRIVG